MTLQIKAHDLETLVSGEYLTRQRNSNQSI